MTDPIFISHSTQDDPFVADLRRALELRGLIAWIDLRNLRGGDRLPAATQPHAAVAASPVAEMLLAALA